MRHFIQARIAPASPGATVASVAAVAFAAVTAVVACAAFVIGAAGCGGAFCGVGEEDEGDEGGEGGGACSANGSFASTPPAGAPSGASCSSGLFWQRGDAESESMHPGVDCIACHAQRGEGPSYFAAGTIMGDVADADDCQGTAGVTVQITGADGQVRESTTNSAGNFFFGADIPVPYTVSLVKDGRTVSMATPQTDGACLSCHTATGANGAPGRILPP